MIEQELERVFRTLEEAINNLSGEVAGVIAVLEEMDGLPKSKKDAIKKKLSRIVAPAFAQGNLRGVAESTVERILKDQ